MAPHPYTQTGPALPRHPNWSLSDLKSESLSRKKVGRSGTGTQTEGLVLGPLCSDADGVLERRLS